MCVRARARVFSSRSPFMFHSFSIRSFRVFSPRSFRVCSLFVPHPFSTCPPFVLRFILHLFSIRSPFVFHPPYVCFSFVVIYFTLILHFPLIRFFIRFFFSFIYHLFSIYSPSRSRFISPFSENLAILSRSQIWFVRGQGSIPFCRVINFPLEFPRSQRMDVKAKRKVFRERLCTSDLVPR